MNALRWLPFVAALALITVAQSASYTITEGQQVVVTQFGRPVGRPQTQAGLHFKVPLVQNVQYIDRRILTWDGYPNQIPTRDKKYILVDTTARWRIHDALKFIQTVANERGATARLDAILDASTRDTISSHNLVEAVRNTNQILDFIAEKQRESQAKLEAGEILVAEEEEVTGEIEKILVGREALSSLVAQRAAQELEQFGITIIDVQLRRISYEASVERKVYERMVSERSRIAEKIRSIGKGERAKIQGKTSRDLQRIESEAYRHAQVIKGKADAESMGIYAGALERDPQFFAFSRTLEAYRQALKPGTQAIISSDAPFLEFLHRAP